MDNEASEQQVPDQASISKSVISTFVCTQQNTQSVCLAQVNGKVKFKVYHDLHISKVSLYVKLNKALHQYGNHMNHKIFPRYLHEHNNNTWYHDGYDDFDKNWRIGFEMFSSNEEKYFLI